MSSSKVINKCQVCGSIELSEILDLGYLPSVNDFQDIDKSQNEQLFFPSKLLQCKKCKLPTWNYLYKLWWRKFQSAAKP